MANEQKPSTDTDGSKKKLIGLSMFFVGVLVAAYLLFVGILLVGGDIETLGAGIAVFVVMVIFGLLAIIGLIIFFLGKMQGDAQEQQEEQQPLPEDQEIDESPRDMQKAGMQFRVLSPTDTSTAFCLGCRQAAPMNNLLYCKEQDVYFHPRCLKAFDFSTWKTE
jgi:uncharacterized membrane protein